MTKEKETAEKYLRNRIIDKEQMENFIALLREQGDYAEDVTIYVSLGVALEGVKKVREEEREKLKTDFALIGIELKCDPKGHYWVSHHDTCLQYQKTWQELARREAETKTAERILAWECKQFSPKRGWGKYQKEFKNRFLGGSGFVSQGKEGEK